MIVAKVSQQFLVLFLHFVCLLLDSLISSSQPGLGTWREVGVLSVADLTTVPASLKVEQAATLWSGALAALRIFEDFNPTGSIVINGAETAVGQALVQMAAYRGLSTVCIVADDLPDIAPVVEGLKYLGGTVVVTESYPINQLKELVSDISKPALGVNICVSLEPITSRMFRSEKGPESCRGVGIRSQQTFSLLFFFRLCVCVWVCLCIRFFVCISGLWMTGWTQCKDVEHIGWIRKQNGHT